MRTFQKIVCSVLLLAGFSPVAKADLEPVMFVEFGYNFMKYKSDELGVFLNAYNSANNPDQPFGMKTGLARCPYLKVGVGIGGNVKCILDFAIYTAVTNPMEARFADGSGRDVWMEHRLSNTNVGIRFGGSKESPAWAQLNMNIGLQTTSIYTAFVFPDGSRSLGVDHTLNGVYSNFVFAGGLGMSAGCRLIGPLGLTITINRVWNFERKNPQYHQFTDNNDVKPSSQQQFLPRDMALYVSEPWNSDNSISNDFRGWQFTGGLILSIGDWGK
jgi:hypothetical protein